MSFKNSAAVLALATMIAAPVPAWAFGGGGAGCSNLPEYYRALGALQGMTSSCDMSLEEARRIVNAYNGTAEVQQAAPAPHAYRRHHRVVPPQE